MPAFAIFSISWYHNHCIAYRNTVADVAYKNMKIGKFGRGENKWKQSAVCVT